MVYLITAVPSDERLDLIAAGEYQVQVFFAIQATVKNMTPMATISIPSAIGTACVPNMGSAAGA
jgi:hypothetical protein